MSSNVNNMVAEVKSRLSNIDDNSVFVREYKNFHFGSRVSDARQIVVCPNTNILERVALAVKNFFNGKRSTEKGLEKTPLHSYFFGDDKKESTKRKAMEELKQAKLKNLRVVLTISIDGKIMEVGFERDGINREGSGCIIQ